MSVVTTCFYTIWADKFFFWQILRPEERRRFGIGIVRRRIRWGGQETHQPKNQRKVCYVMFFMYNKTRWSEFEISVLQNYSILSDIIKTGPSVVGDLYGTGTRQVVFFAVCETGSARIRIISLIWVRNILSPLYFSLQLISSELLAINANIAVEKVVFTFYYLKLTT
jgi:hypothetical protein